MRQTVYSLTCALMMILVTPASLYAAPEEQNDNKYSNYPDVTLYSASWCGICRRARDYFTANQIPFDEYDVESTQKGFDDFRLYRGRGVPLIFVGSQRMDGFSVARFQQLYKPVR